MEIPISQDDPKGKLIQFKARKRTGTLERVRAPYGACKHERIYVVESRREIECQSCKTKLDPFAVLLELATKQRRWLEELDAWDAYRESKLSERYDEQWERDHEGVLEPPADTSLRNIWDTFNSAIGEGFCGMYRRRSRMRNGPEWYGRGAHGLVISYEYARSKLVPKAVVG